MYGWSYTGWANAGASAVALGMEASAVIGLRMVRMASGGAASGEEVQRMVSEKLASALELQTAMLTGQLGTTPLEGTQKILRHYRRKVRANRRRLS
jgi:hypothetical protein